MVICCFQECISQPFSENSDSFLLSEPLSAKYQQSIQLQSEWTEIDKEWNIWIQIYMYLRLCVATE